MFCDNNNQPYLISLCLLMVLISSCGGGSQTPSEDNNQNNSTNSVTTSVSVADELTANQLESDSRYNKLIDQVIAPILSSEAYELSVGAVRTFQEHRAENPIKCFTPIVYDVSGITRCFDKNSYPDSEELWFQIYSLASSGYEFANLYPWVASFDDFNKDVVISKPLEKTMTWVGLSDDATIIFPLNLKLKKTYKDQMKVALTEISDRVNKISYGHLFPVCVNNSGSPVSCSDTYDYLVATCLKNNACSTNYSIVQEHVYDESYVVSYVDRSEKTNYFYETSLKKKITEEDNWLNNIWWDFYRSWNGLGNELSSLVNRFYSIRIKMIDSSGNVLKTIDFESDYPLSRIKGPNSAVCNGGFTDLNRYIKSVGFMSLNKGSYTYDRLDQVINVSHIPSLMTVQRHAGDNATSSCMEPTIWSMNSNPLYSKMTIIDELDFEVVLETDEITKNTASITAELIYIKDADYNLYSYSR